MGKGKAKGANNNHHNSQKKKAGHARQQNKENYAYINDTSLPCEEDIQHSGLSYICFLLAKKINFVALHLSPFSFVVRTLRFEVL